jgi:hypothetical protein
MNHLVDIFTSIDGAAIDRAFEAARDLPFEDFLKTFPGWFAAAGGGGAVSAAVLAAGVGDLPEGIRATILNWHGTYDQQHDNVLNLIKIIKAHGSWAIPTEAYKELTDMEAELAPLMQICGTTSASSVTRMKRRTLVKALVALCLSDMKTWALEMYRLKQLTADDVHELGFRLLGERGGHHARVMATNVTPAIKIRNISGEIVRVIVDKSAGENAAGVTRGWPEGVKYVLIIIVSVDDREEIVRLISTRVYNDITMPEGSRGKQFEVKASFLKHTDDEPRFGNAPVFSMPLTTDDLIARVDRHAHEDLEEKLQEVEQRRLELEQLRAEIEAAKKSKG